MADNSFKSNVEALLKGMDGIISSKTVVGDPVKVEDTIIIPLVDVSFAVGAGAFSNTGKNNGGGGMGGKVTPNAVLILQNGSSRIISIKDQSGLTKILDMVPDFVNKFVNKDDKKEEEEEELDKIFKEDLENKLNEK